MKQQALMDLARNQDTKTFQFKAVKKILAIQLKAIVDFKRIRSNALSLKEALLSSPATFFDKAFSSNSFRTGLLLY